MDDKATLEQVHNMVTQLITMVSKMQSDMGTLKAGQDELKAGQERISDVVEAHSLQISRLAHDAAVLQVRQDEFLQS